LHKGYAVSVRDVRSEAEQQAQAEGMQVCTSPASLAALVDVVLVVVVDAGQIEAVLFGTPDCPGLVQSGAAPLVLLCSTIAPQDSVQLAQRLAGHGVATLDAPISGGPARAQDGSMSMMLAGAPALLQQWAPLLEDLAARRFYLGAQVGDASKAKLVNNLLAGINLVAGAEALSLGIKLGLERQTIFDLIAASSGSSWVFQDRMARAIADDFAPRAAAPILTKDMGLATQLAASIQHATPLGDVALQKFRDTLDQGWAALDDAAVIKTYLP
jgi:3-hydroxyisobutyrate dehydrogenase